MKRNLLTLLIGSSFLFAGASVIRAETPLSLPGNIKMSKKSVASNAVKLKKIESILKKGEALHKQECATPCSSAFDQILITWAATNIICDIVG